MLAVLVAIADRRDGAAVVIATVVFILVTSEWTTLLRRRADAANRSDSADILRLVTWNVARSPDLRALELLQPDLCLFQESAPVVGHPMTVGPWAPPQAIVLHLPSGARVLVVNVRLVLPGIVMKIASPSDPIDLRAQHRDRVAQFARLSTAVSAARRVLGGIQAIVCGDFNTPARAASVRALSPLTDIWPRAGRGWGATMGDDLPIARIDQCWTSEGVQPLQAWVERGRGSDHRLLVADLEIR